MSTPYSRRGGGGWKGKRNYGDGGFKRSNAGSHASQQKRPPAVETEVAMDTTNCPYTKWGLYLKDYAYVEGSELANKVALLRVYFENNIHQFNKEEIEEKEEVYLDFQAIHSDHAFVKTFPTFKKDLMEDPTQIIGAIRTVLHQLLEDQQFEDSQKSCLFDVAFLHVRLLNFQPPTGLKDLKASSFGKLVSVNGTVVRVSNVKPIVTKMAFSCNSCSEVQVLHLPDGKYLAPIKCSCFDCRGRSFTPQRCSSSTETIDWQNVKLQEVMSDEQRETGRIPRTIECELTAGLVDSCVPGDKVTCTGIVKVTQAEESNGKKSKDKSVYLLYIHAISLSNNKQVQAGEKEADQSEFTMKELYAIQEIQSDKNSFRLIVGSLCPAIYGHVLVKAGLLLALFGGTQKYVDSRNLIPVRGDPHVLVVGDPGLGKSQMLQAAANVAPRGVYVCGNTTTTTGLTVTLSKEAGSGNYSLEAGALVLADRGCCCIDEFDKMGNQHQALLEAMEQQSISIAKAGILCSLPARTSILAAANPVGGHYNRGKTVAENLKMGSALLSRFDLVFILLDKPDEELDSILSEHVMSLHSEKARAVQTVTVERNQESRASLDQWNKDKPLLERLRVARGAHDFDALPPQLLRKYIQYARKYVHPQLSTQAGRVLQEFYLNLRKQRLGGNCTPITTRQLEALIRLTQARARAELRETATKQDANDVIEIMKSSLIDTFIDENGSLDYSRSQNGSGMSKRAQAKKFITELTNISERDQNSLFNMDQMHRIYKQLKLNAGSFEDFISSLNSQNFLLKKGPKLYQLQTSSCV